MGPSHQKDPRTGRDRRGDGAGRARGGAGGAPGAVRGGVVSESVAKASRGGIGGEQKRGISTIRLARPGSIGVFATDLDNRRRRGPLHGRRPWRSLRSWTGPAPTPGCRGVHFALERALLTAPFECKMHISRAECTSRRAQDRPAPTTPDGSSPHRPAPTPVPDHDPRREGPSGLTAALFCLDHLRALGPPGPRNTVVQPHLSGPSRPRASRHARRRPTMRDALSGRSEGVAGEPPRRPARPIPTSPGSPRDDRPVDPNASDALQHTRRRLERVIAVDLPHPAPPPSPDNPLHHTRETHSDAR